MGGWEVEFGEKEEVEKCGERSVEAQLVRPPHRTSCCLRRARQQPACLPAWLYVPALISPPPALPLSCPPVESAQLFQAFSYSPATMHPDLLLHLQTSVQAPEYVHLHISPETFCPVESVIPHVISKVSQ